MDIHKYKTKKHFKDTPAGKAKQIAHRLKINTASEAEVNKAKVIDENWHWLQSPAINTPSIGGTFDFRGLTAQRAVQRAAEHAGQRFGIGSYTMNVQPNQPMQETLTLNEVRQLNRIPPMTEQQSLELYGITPAQLDALIPNMAVERQYSGTLLDHIKYLILHPTPEHELQISELCALHNLPERALRHVFTGRIYDSMVDVEMDNTLVASRGIHFDTMTIDEVPANLSGLDYDTHVDPLQSPSVLEHGEQISMVFVYPHIETIPLQPSPAPYEGAWRDHPLQQQINTKIEEDELNQTWVKTNCTDCRWYQQNEGRCNFPLPRFDPWTVITTFHPLSTSCHGIIREIYRRIYTHTENAWDLPFYLNELMNRDNPMKCKGRKPIPCPRCQRYMQGINNHNKLELPLVPNELKLNNSNSILL